MYVIKKSLSSVVVLTTCLLTTSAFAMETGFTDMPPEDRSFVIKRTAYEQCLDDKTPVTMNETLVNLELVCKEWQYFIKDEMKVGAPSWKAWYGVVGHEEIYQQFLNGVFIYKPDPQSDEGMIQLKISDLPNPLEGTFDLSKCGNTGKDLSISTGYRKERKAENSNKQEIWLATLFMIAKKLKSSASHFQSMMDKLKEETDPYPYPYLMAWSWGSWDDLSWYDYLTMQGAISSKNLREYKQEAVWCGHTIYTQVPSPHMSMYMFSFSFVNQNKNY